MLRDTTITSAMKRRELWILGICLIAAYVLNIIGIIANGSPARELVTQLHVVLLIGLIFYGVVVVLRILYYLVSRLWTRK